MNKNEFSEYIKQVQEIYSKQLNDVELDIWYNTLKYMSIERFNNIISELYKTSKYMPRLADILEVSKRLPNPDMPKQENKKCEKCNGTGYITYTKIIENTPYTYAAVCDCGKQQRYDGRKCTDAKNQSKYYIPTAKEINLEIVHTCTY